jgi:hypothetical protein
MFFEKFEGLDDHFTDLAFVMFISRGCCQLVTPFFGRELARKQVDDRLDKHAGG